MRCFEDHGVGEFCEFCPAPREGLDPYVSVRRLHPSRFQVLGGGWGIPVWEAFDAGREFDWDVNNHVARLSYLFAPEPEQGFDQYGPWAVWPGMHPRYGE